MPEAICYLHDILVPNWDNVTPQKIENLYEWMSGSKWFGKKGNRMGFVNVIRHGSMIGGYFSTEGARETRQYDEAKVPEERYESSFQEVFFTLFTDEGQLLLQERRVYDYVDLSMDVIRRDFSRTLADGFRSVGVVVGNEVQLGNAGGERTQEELIQFFRKTRVLSVEVSKLSHSQIPENLTDIFNPTPELLPSMRLIVSGTLRKGLDRVRMTSDGAPESDLGHAPIPYALAAAGQIEKIEAKDEHGMIVYREKHEKAEVRLEIPVSPNLTPNILDRVFERLDELSRRDSARYRSAQRRSNLKRGTMFDQHDS